MTKCWLHDENHQSKEACNALKINKTHTQTRRDIAQHFEGVHSSHQVAHEYEPPSLSLLEDGCMALADRVLVLMPNFQAHGELSKPAIASCYDHPPGIYKLLHANG